MKVGMISAVAFMASAFSVVAYAGEGRGNPFPFRAPGVVSSTMGVKLSPLLNDNPYGYSAKAQSLTQGQLQELPVTGSEEVPESTNGLPPGAEDTPQMLAHDPVVHPALFASHNYPATHG